MAHTVLLVDDDPFFQKLVPRVLRESGVKVVVAKSWLEFAGTYYRLPEPPDLILFDVNLGAAMSGDKLLKTFGRESHGEPGRRKTRLVLFSSIPESELADRSRRAGADGYISKQSLAPASGAPFLSQVRSFLQQPA